MQSLLAPALKFHEAAAGSTKDDITFRWEIVAMRGEEEFFAKVSGISCMTGLLSKHQVHLSPERVYTEIQEKVARPITAKFREYANQMALLIAAAEDELAAAPRAKQKAALPPPAASEQDIAATAELISQQSLDADEL